MPAAVLPIFKKNDWRENVQRLRELCTQLKGTFVPDDEEKVFACLVDDHRVNISYFRDKNMFVVALSGDNVVMSVATRDFPSFTVSDDGFAVSVDRVEAVKLFTVSPTIE